MGLTKKNNINNTGYPEGMKPDVCLVGLIFLNSIKHALFLQALPSSCSNFSITYSLKKYTYIKTRRQYNYSYDPIIEQNWILFSFFKGESILTF